MHALNRHAVLAITALAFVAVVIAAIACAGPAAEPTASQPAAPQPTAMPAATSAPPATNTPVPPLPTNTPEPPAQAPAETTAAPEPTNTPVPPTEAPVSSSGGGTVFRLGEGTIARYRVEEVLASTGFKIAIGETADVAGTVVFAADGSVVADESRIAVQAATLRTDSNRRDGYVRNRTLETDNWPEVVFVPRSFDGLPVPISDANGPAEFTITGDLTVRDQTREVTWDAAAEFAGDGTVTGSASVEFTFDDFGMDKPRVAIVVSVEDTIRLELDFVGTMAIAQP